MHFLTSVGWALRALRHFRLFTLLFASNIWNGDFKSEMSFVLAFHCLLFLTPTVEILQNDFAVVVFLLFLCGCYGVCLTQWRNFHEEDKWHTEKDFLCAEIEHVLDGNVIAAGLQWRVVLWPQNALEQTVCNYDVTSAFRWWRGPLAKEPRDGLRSQLQLLP